jgi:hypothetical protein
VSACRRPIRRSISIAICSLVDTATRARSSSSPANLDPLSNVTQKEYKWPRALPHQTPTTSNHGFKLRSFTTPSAWFVRIAASGISRAENLTHQKRACGSFSSRGLRMPKFSTPPASSNSIGRFSTHAPGQKRAGPPVGRSRRPSSNRSHYDLIAPGTQAGTRPAATWPEQKSARATRSNLGRP